MSARPSFTKSKRQANIRLHEQVVVELRLIKPLGNVDGTKVFAGQALPGMWAFKTDLLRAGINYADPQNRKADFHALRYTFATNLSKAGVLPREAMELTRHSDMRLTMKTYTDAGLLCTGEAVSKLPFFAVTPAGQALVGPLAALPDTQIDTQTPDSNGLELAFPGTDTLLEFGSEDAENEHLRHDLALSGTVGQIGRNGSSGRIRSFFPVGYREKMDDFSSEGKASLALGCQ